MQYKRQRQNVGDKSFFVVVVYLTRAPVQETQQLNYEVLTEGNTQQKGENIQRNN